MPRRYSIPILCGLSSVIPVLQPKTTHCMKPLRELFNRQSLPELSALDEFYRATVSKFSAPYKRQYCVNLVGRLQEDLKSTNCEDEIRAIKMRIQAAGKEIERLDS